jgi:hypothetical protein
LETTQGNILKLDNGMYSISGLKVGNVSLTIFKKSVGQAKLIFSKKFRVTATPEESAWSSLMPTPIISLGNLMEGKVNLDSLKNAQALIISKPYKLNSASFLLGHQTLHRIETENFDLSLKAKLKYLKVNDCISIFDIKVSDPNGNIYKFPKDLHYCAQ